jgi:hypothetical protein
MPKFTTWSESILTRLLCGWAKLEKIVHHWIHVVLQHTIERYTVFLLCYLKHYTMNHFHALAAWSSGIVCHRGDWSWDRIPPGYRVVVLKINVCSSTFCRGRGLMSACYELGHHMLKHFPAEILKTILIFLNFFLLFFYYFLDCVLRRRGGGGNRESESDTD